MKMIMLQELILLYCYIYVYQYPYRWLEILYTRYRRLYPTLTILSYRSVVTEFDLESFILCNYATIMAATVSNIFFLTASVTGQIHTDIKLNHGKYLQPLLFSVTILD